MRAAPGWESPAAGKRPTLDRFFCIMGILVPASQVCVKNKEIMNVKPLFSRVPAGTNVRGYDFPGRVVYFIFCFVT